MKFVFALAVLAASLLPSESQACFLGKRLFSRGCGVSQSQPSTPAFQLGVKPAPEAKTVPLPAGQVPVVTGDCANGQCGQPTRTFSLRGLFRR